MDIRKVKKLIELLEESGLAELEITEGEESVRISRQMTGGPVQYAMPQMAYAAGPASRRRRRTTSPATPRAAPITAETDRPQSAVADGRHLLRSARARLRQIS